MISRFLDTNGDGTGTKTANGDYSSAADEFYFEAAGYTELHRMIVHIEDTFGAQFNEYGNLGAALTNGIVVQVKDENDVVLQNLTDGEPILTNGDWGRFCYDVRIEGTGASSDIIQARWTFTKSGRPLELDPGHKFIVTLNDSFTGLIDHTFMVQGILS